MNNGIAFLSYRGGDFEIARKAAQFLLEKKFCANGHIFPPNLLCERGELLLPYEYYELMGYIRDALANCDDFYFLDTPTYAESYFTQAEVLQWQAYRDNPVFYRIRSKGNSFAVEGPISVGNMNNSQKQLIANLAVNIDKSQQSHFNPGFMGGKYNRNCFLVPCGQCGEHFLATQKYIYSVLNNVNRLTCPHCNNSNFSLQELNKNGKFYRKPIILKQSIVTNFRVLDISEIHELLVLNTLPKNIGLVKLKDETLSSDIAKVAKFWGGAALIVTGIILFSKLISNDKD
jgi:hypothetical protein